MSLQDEFNVFWHYYPRRVGKLAAQRAYVKARTVASADAIMRGVENFVRHMPREAEYRPHPATWLNQGRWDDEYETPKPQRHRAEVDWFEECQRIHNGECGLSQDVHRTRKVIEEGRLTP